MRDFLYFTIAANCLMLFLVFHSARDFAYQYLCAGRNKKKAKQICSNMTAFEKLTLLRYADVCPKNRFTRKQLRNLKYAIAVNMIYLIYFPLYIVQIIFSAHVWMFCMLLVIFLMKLILVDLPFMVFTFLHHSYSKSGGKEWRI